VVPALSDLLDSRSVVVASLRFGSVRRTALRASPKVTDETRWCRTIRWVTDVDFQNRIAPFGVAADDEYAHVIASRQRSHSDALIWRLLRTC
jgi:hypothetical protein